MIETRTLCLTLAFAAIISCKPDPGPSSGSPSATASAASAVVSTAANAPPSAPLPAPVREGGALVRSASGDALYIADEDHGVVRRIGLPLEGPAPSVAITMPGAPAQVLALGDRVLVSVRDPGLLLIMRPDPTAGLVEVGRVPLPADAWGIAISPDEKTALVSSAFSHQVSAVDLETRTKRWSIDVAREPRAIVIRPDGRSAYVTHLVGAAVTRIDDLLGTPSAHAVALPPAPARAPSSKTLHASLGYSAVLSDDGRRLFVARHALGALGTAAWFGAATVDVLATTTDTPVLAKRQPGLLAVKAEILKEFPNAEPINVAGVPVAPFVQPRAMVYRKSAKTLLIAGEGNDRVVEVDALAPAPALQPFMIYRVGSDYKTTGDVGLGIANRCGAPTGLALSSDEGTLYVFCRATYDLTAIKLVSPEVGMLVVGAPSSVVHLADDPLPNDVAMGRRFFYSGTDNVSSGGDGAGMGCAGCHPEGRDDGHVWHEAVVERMRFSGPVEHKIFIGEPENAPNAEGGKIGYPRQTPMLAGRVDAPGPYGWHAQNPDIVERIKEGFTLHRWGRFSDVEYGGPAALVVRAHYLRAFLRQGLVPPPREARALTPAEEQGRTIFNSPAAGCAKCHVPTSEYTDRTAYPMPLVPSPPGFDNEADRQFKTPSLRFVGATPPYFHDGRASSLEQLIDKNNNGMGHTNHLSKEERAALVAFLRIL
jgi:hypothetical protein